MMKRTVYAGGSKSRSWFWWGINIGVFLALAAWWWLRNQDKDRAMVSLEADRLILPPDDDIEPEAPAAPEPLPVQPEPETPENLQVVEGIGPRSAQVLGEAGVKTFAALAALEPDAIRDILRAANVRVPYPATWPEQAALAAAGDWQALDELKDRLVGGRRG